MQEQQEGFATEIYKHPNASSAYLSEDLDEREYAEEYDDPDVRPEITDEQLKKVYRLNIIATIFQAVTGVIVIVLTDPDKGKYIWYTNFPNIDDEANGDPYALGPESKDIFSFAVGYLAGAFLLLSCLDHFICAFVGRAAYERGLRENYNAFRWIEYAVSASVMHVHVSLLSGISDIHMLFLIFGLTACTMLYGLLFELENSGGRKLSEVTWRSFWIGFIPHAFVWSVIFCYFFRNVSLSDPPNFVWAIIIIIFILDLTFAINLWLQWRGRGRFHNYIGGEIGFIILSFTSKQLLCWINFGGSNR